MFGPETGVLVGALNAYYVTNGAADLANLSPYPTAIFTPGDVIFNAAPTPGSPAFWTVSTGGLTPVFQAGPALATGQVATFNLTAAQLIAMYTTPITLVAAPGAGKALVFNWALFEMTTTATAFTGGGATSFLLHGTSTNVGTGTIPASVVTAAAGTSYTLIGGPSAANGTTLLANTGIDITNATAAFATGTGTAKVQISYSVITL